MSPTMKTDELQAKLDLAQEENIELAQRNVELSETIDDLNRKLEAKETDLRAAMLDAQVHADNVKLLKDRLQMVQQQVGVLEHNEKQWRETAQANERLHNAAHEELQSVRAQLAMRGT